MNFLLKNFTLKSLLICLTLSFCLSPFSIIFINAEGEDTDKAPAPVSAVLHVKAGGEGDGSTSDTPMADIGKAFRLLSEAGGEIIVYGKYELSASSCHDKTWEAFVEPVHKGKITVSGVDAFLVCKENYRYYTSGKTEFKNIGISGSGALIIAARFNPLIMGEGINIVGCSDGVFLIGGYNGSNSGLTDEALGKNSYIEIKSGTYKFVSGYNKGTSSKNCTGEASIVISGGKINCVAAGISGSSTLFSDNTMAKLKLSVTGGEIYKICDTDMTGYGTLSELYLDFSGGAIENIIISEKTSSSVSFTEQTSDKIAEFLRYFDSYKKDGGELTSTDKIKVACVGDSITLGIKDENENYISYPKKLGEMLGDSYDIGNFGEGGATVLTSSGSAYINSQKYKDSLDFLPNVVFIMLGTNDLSSLISSDNAKAELKNDIIALIQSYSALPSKPVIYLLSPTQRTDASELDAALRDILVPLYKQIAEETTVGFIDIYEISKSIKNQFPDAIHPNETASSHIATWLYSAVVTNSNINKINPNTTHVELVINSEAPTQTPVTEQKQNKKESSGGLVTAMLLFVLGEAGCFTYLALKKRNNSSSEDKNGKDTEPKNEADKDKGIS